MNICVWTDADLDGACSNLLLKWLFKGVKLTTKVTTAKKFNNEFPAWYDLNKSEFDKIFICDLDCSGSMDSVDHTGIVIIDHHESHFDLRDKYEYAKVIVCDMTSTAMIIYNEWRDDLKLTREQQLLVRIVDDYDSYTLQYGEITTNLNKMFWQYTGDRCQKFADDFAEGFAGFTRLQQNSINLYDKRIKDTLRTMEVAAADVPIGSHTQFVVAGVSDFGINDIAVHLLKEYDADIAIIVNPKSGTVSFRRATDCVTPLHTLAATLAEGGGHAAAAGGKITDTFLEFTKILKNV